MKIKIMESTNPSINGPFQKNLCLNDKMTNDFLLFMSLTHFSWERLMVKFLQANITYVMLSKHSVFFHRHRYVSLSYAGRPTAVQIFKIQGEIMNRSKGMPKPRIYLYIFFTLKFTFQWEYGFFQHFLFRFPICQNRFSLFSCIIIPNPKIPNRN